jgi:hypothetical protein
MPNMPATLRIWTAFAPLRLRAEDPQRHERAARGGLAPHERREQRQRHRREQQRPPRAPAELRRRADDRVDAEHQRGGDQHGAWRVGALAQPEAAVVRQQPARRQRRAHTDRDVHEEDPVPVDRLRQHPAREQPDRPAGRGHERVDADRLRLLARLREHRHDHPEDHRRGHRAAGALEEARADQNALAGGDAAQDRGDREHCEPREEDLPAPDQVAEPPGQQQQAAERDQIGVHHPRQRRGREAEVVLDRRQRDVHDRDVEHDHQHPRAEDVQGGPGVRSCGV